MIQITNMIIHYEVFSLYPLRPCTFLSSSMDEISLSNSRSRTSYLSKLLVCLRVILWFIMNLSGSTWSILHSRNISRLHYCGSLILEANTDMALNLFSLNLLLLLLLTVYVIIQMLQNDLRHGIIWWLWIESGLWRSRKLPNKGLEYVRHYLLY